MSDQKSNAIDAYQDAIRQHDVPAGELEVYDSCSWRRVGMKGQYKTVMQPCVASDGHPDIIGGNVLRALVAAFNAMPAALAEIDVLRKSESEVNELYIEQRQRAVALKAEVAEHEQSFDLRWKADMRAIKRWQEAHPGKENVWPDHADLCVWLLEQLDLAAQSVGYQSGKIEALQDKLRAAAQVIEWKSLYQKAEMGWYASALVAEIKGEPLDDDMERGKKWYERRMATPAQPREWYFDRYRDGKLMAEGMQVNAVTEAEAIERATSRSLSGGHQLTDELRLRNGDGLR